MRRSASEIIRNLDSRIARLERKESNRTASWSFKVHIMNTRREPYNESKKMTLKQLLKLLDKQQFGGRTCTMTFYGGNFRPHVKFECFKNIPMTPTRNSPLEWICEVDTSDLVEAIQTDYLNDYIRLEMRLAKKLNKKTYEIENDDPAMAELVEYFLMSVVPLAGGWKSSFFPSSDKKNLL
jgi:hypothetical protein